MRFSTPDATPATSHPDLGWLGPDTKAIKNKQHKEKSFRQLLLRIPLFREDVPLCAGPEQNPSPTKKDRAHAVPLTLASKL